MSVFDFNEKEYNSIEDMCSHYNIPVKTYLMRIKAGYTIERALTTPLPNYAYIADFIPMSVKVRTIRKANSMTRKQFGLFLKDIANLDKAVADAYISDVENSARAYSPDVYMGLSKKFGLSIDYLFARTPIYDAYEECERVLPGERIRSERELMQMNRSEYAKYLTNTGLYKSCTATYVKLLEEGKKSMPMHKLLKYAYVTGLSLDYLLGITDVRKVA